MKWILGVLATAVAATLAAWFGGLLHQAFPSPQWVRLAVKTQWRGVPRPSPDRFRIVLCWLENDYNGENAANAEAAFSGVNGITLVRSRETVSASGAGDEWRETIQEEARAVLEREKADVAIVGKVKSRKRVARVMREAGLARVIHRPLTPQILVLPKW